MVHKEKKICVVGAGYWGKNHIRTLHELGALKGIVDSNQEVLSLYLKRYSNIYTHDSLEHALKKNYDAYIVSTPAETHYSIAKEIILRKKPVLIEKPLALNIKNAEELVTLANLNKVQMMVGHVLLFHPAINKIKEIIHEGKIGKLQYIYSNRLNLGKVRADENVFWSFAPHDISVFLYLTNSYPEKIKASGSTFLQKNIHDSTITQMSFPNGVDSHIFVSWIHPFKEHRLVVVGSEAMITFEDSLDGKPLKFHSKKVDVGLEGPKKIDGPVRHIKYDNFEPLKKELEYFLDCIESKEEIKIANGSNALKVIRILSDASDDL